MQFSSRLVLAALSLGSLLCCGPVPDVDATGVDGRAIVNGTRDPQNTFLTAGQVQAIVYLADPGGDEFCSGTLVAPRAVATARHCVEGEVPEGLFVGFGVQPADPDGFLPVAAIHINSSIDFALLILGLDATVAVAGVTPIAINREAVTSFWVHRWVDAAGYGDTYSAATGRYFASVEIIGSDSETVTVDGHGEQGICYGDSGGPILWQPDAGTPPVLVGTEQYGDSSCVDVDHLTRVDVVAPFVDAILAEPLPPEFESCGTVTSRGECRDGDAVRCLGGYLRRDDCSGLGLDCADFGQSYGAQCVPEECGATDVLGRCDGNLLYRCTPDGLTFRDCGVIHRQCVTNATDGTFTCGGCYTCGAECADLMVSLKHCGACDQPCAPADAVGVCVSGICSIEKCKKGFADENGDVRDGCEVEQPDGGCSGTGRTRPLLALGALLFLLRRRRR
jgi:hypothetical protein